MERYYIAKGMLATETGVLEQFPLGIPEFLIEVCKAADAQQRITDLEQQVQALNKERDEYMSKEGPSDGFWGRNCARLLEREKLAQAALRRAKAEGLKEAEQYALTCLKELQDKICDIELGKYTLVGSQTKEGVAEWVHAKTLQAGRMAKWITARIAEVEDDARAAQIENEAIK